MVAELTKTNEALRAQKQAKLGLKVGEKGTIVLTGVRRFPVSLYWTEWETVLGFLGTPSDNPIAAFYHEHKAEIDELAEASREARRNS
jgi:hypothetical protein